MAQIIKLVSDFDAKKDVKNVEATVYRVNGVEYTADLGDIGRKAVADAQAKAAEILRAAEAEVDAIMAEFVAIGAEVKPVKAIRTPRTGDDRAASLRVWLAANPAAAERLATLGFTVADRGRIAEGVWARAAEAGWVPNAPAAIG